MLEISASATTASQLCYASGGDSNSAFTGSRDSSGTAGCTGKFMETFGKHMNVICPQQHMKA